MDTPTVTEGPATKSAQKHGNLRRSVVWRRGRGGGGSAQKKRDGGGRFEGPEARWGEEKEKRG